MVSVGERIEQQHCVFGGCHLTEIDVKPKITTTTTTAYRVDLRDGNHTVTELQFRTESTQRSTISTLATILGPLLIKQANSL